MGKEWLYWGSSKSAKRGRFAARDENDEAPPPSGCMCAVLQQLFDLNHFQFALHQQPSFKPDAFLQEEPTLCKGVEAPRNSLELVEPSMEAASLSTITKEDTYLNLPVGIQIKTRCDIKSPRESTSECSGSPGTKTPSLVARLMGLDLLPEGGSPSSSSSRSHSSSNLSAKSRLHHHHQAQNQYEDRARHLLEIKSSSSKISNGDKNSSSGTRSLPETPRVSSARRSDVDHRLSLQINKENSGEEFDLSAYIAKKVARRREARQEDENRSPGHYARQILKQVKEKVSRKVGVDITNTIKSRDLQAKDEHDHQNDHVVLLKPKKQSRVLTRSSDESTPSCSPRLRFLDTKNTISVTTLPNKNQTSHSPNFSSFSSSSAENHSPKEKIPLQTRPNAQFSHQQTNQQDKPMTQKCGKIASQRFSSRLKKPPQASDAIRNKREDPFVRSPSKNNKVDNHLTDKMCKKIPLSNELLNNNVPTLLPVKKHPSPPGKILIHKQSQAYDDAPSSRMSTQLSSCSSQSYNQEATHSLAVLKNNRDDKCNGATTSSGDEAEYYQYIQRILKRTCIVDKSTPVSLAKWYSPTHPLDPAIFHHIELFHHTHTTIFTAKNSKLNHRCNRKLIFQLVDELLAEILNPYMNFKPWVSVLPFSQKRCQMHHGSDLIDTLCSRIEAFPSADCQVLEDIDALIDKDLRKYSQLRRSNIAFEEEGENIVTEIEREIVESLVHEMVMQSV